MLIIFKLVWGINIRYGQGEEIIWLKQR
jgi:hypothetical protein